MAYVNRSSVGCRGSSGERSAQAIILTGFLIAISVVVIAFLLNSLIFAQDLSTRDDGVDDRGILGFGGDTERVAHEVAATPGHNSLGKINATQGDLFADNSEVRGNFDDIFGDGGDFDVNSTYHLERRQAMGDIDVSEDDVVWSLGQRGLEPLENESGESGFVVVEDLGTDFEDSMTYFELEVQGFDTEYADEFFVTGAEENFEGLDFPPGRAVGLADDIWQIYYNDTSEELTVNTTGGLSDEENDVRSATDWDQVDNFTIIMDDFDGGDPDETTLIVEGEVYDDPTFREDAFSQLQALLFEDDGEIDKRWEARFDGDHVEPEDGMFTCGDEEACIYHDPGSDRELHVVGVPDGKLELTYASGDVEHIQDIDVSVPQNDLLLEEVED